MTKVGSPDSIGDTLGEVPDLYTLPRRFRTPIGAVQLALKRAMDIVGAGLGLVVLAPLLGAIALWVLADSGRPVLFRWNVVGRRGQPFTGYKFRTMVRDAETRQAELASQNEMRGPVFKMKHDPRVTRAGRVLRRYSLDELPQLWSVLKGDMSLVGPRPPLRKEWDRYELWQRRKLAVTPGVTCLWQVSGRSDIRDFDRWIAMDVEYIDRWSLWLDLRILGKTIATVVSGRGAY